MIMIPKFRAWHRKEKKMYDVEKIDFKCKLITTSDNVYYFNEVTLMQSLVRSKRRDDGVFEGDFVRIISGGYSLSDMHIVVKNELGVFVLQGLNHTTKKFGDMEIKRHMRFEVLGNVHKNDELTKKYWGQGEK